MRLLLMAGLVIMIQACAGVELSPEEKALRDKAAGLPIASSITVTELAQYKEVGPVSCSQDTVYYSSGGADETCRDHLKLSAARLGGDLIVLEARDTARCEIGDHLCVFMHGRAYKKNSSEK